MYAHLLFFLITFSYAWASNVKCPQCPKVFEECAATDAVEIDCGSNGVCLRQIRKGSNNNMAIRKCVVPDLKTQQVDCPDGFDCRVCDTTDCVRNNLMNSEKGFSCVICATGCAVTKATERRACGTAIGDNQDAYCLKQYKPGNEDNAIRRCVLTPKNKMHQCEDGYKCQLCQENDCNAASNIKLSLFGVLSTTFLICIAQFWY